MKIDAVVFDWAGTIIDFGSQAPMGAFVDLFKKHGVNVTVEQARVPMGLPKIDHIREMGAMPDISLGWKAAHNGHDFTDEDAHALLKEFEPASAQSAWECRAFIPGFLETYSWLKSKGIRVSTTTGYTRRIMTPIIEHAAKQGFAPDKVICCDDVLRSRPDPMGMIECCQAMGVEPGMNVLKVDDTAPGIAEALNAGCMTIGVWASGNALGWPLERWLKTQDNEDLQIKNQAKQLLLSAGAHQLISTVADLPKAIESIERNAAA